MTIFFCKLELNHAANTTKQWFGTNNITDMEHWSPQSPNLNPIENIWQYCDRKVHEVTFHNFDELWEEIKRVWYVIPKELIGKLADSLPK